MVKYVFWGVIDSDMVDLVAGDSSPVLWFGAEAGTDNFPKYIFVATLLCRPGELI